MGSFTTRFQYQNRITLTGAGGGGTSFRYWRMSFSGAVDASATGVEFEEAEFLTSGVDQTGSGTASASSEFAGEPASAAFADDGATTKWASDFSDTWPQWLAYDFGAGNEKTIDAVSITPTVKERAPEDIDVQRSSDGSNWTSVWSVNTGVLTDWASHVKRTFNKP